LVHSNPFFVKKVLENPKKLRKILGIADHMRKPGKAPSFLEERRHLGSRKNLLLACELYRLSHSGASFDDALGSSKRLFFWKKKTLEKKRLEFLPLSALISEEVVELFSIRAV